MIRVRYHFLCFLFLGILLFPKLNYAQELEEPTDDLGNVSDAFQDNFFEALKQKGIENYELALEALTKAEKAAKDDSSLLAVVNSEIAKNLVSVRRYRDAQPYFMKVLESEGDRLDVMEALYDLYYQERDYNAAIPLVKRLIEFDDDYKEDLANLYSRTKQYDKALTLLDELDESWGESDYRDALRTQIYRATGNTTGEIEKLEEKVDTNPKNERDYLNLIYLYSEEGNTEKAFKTAKELLSNNPKSELVHLALYKFYLDEGNASEAINSMKKVFASSQIDKESQFKVLGDFIQFVNANPSYESDLEKIVDLFSADDNGVVFEKLGDYYMTKGRNEDALKFYEKGVAIDEDNYSLLKNTLLLQIDFKKYESAAALSAQGLEIFPAQALIYLLNGVANNKLQNIDVAIESLETGIDYLLDDPKMEKDFYEQLNLAYTGKGDTKKANLYAKKALELKDSN